MDERNRRRLQRERARRRRRRALVLRSILLAAALLILIGLFALIRAVLSQQSSVSEEPQTSTVQTAPADGEVRPEETLPEMLELTEEQIHTGDLILVNGTYPYDFAANDHSTTLVTIREKQSISYPVDKEEFQVAANILPHLDEMIAACSSALNVSDTSISSAWRSKDYQQNVWNETAELYGEDYANQYVAAPGYSEHHTGLAVDLGITNADGSAGSFSESGNAAWMDEHSWEYGFVRRFREDKVAVTGISNESWHFRYVGYPHAKYMKEQNLALEEYISYLRDHTSSSDPLTISGNDHTWKIYFTSDTRIEVPAVDYEISGNNVDGYLITEQIS